MGTATGGDGYSFGRWRLLPEARRLLADGEPVALGSRAFDVLLALVEARGELVTKDALLHRVWPCTIVEENNLQVQISALRRTLGADAARCIATIPGRGYRFTAEVRAAAPAAALPAASPPAATPLGRRPMVIVLPFENIGGAPEEGYFSAGLTADLVTDLTRFESLHVVAPRRGTDISGAPLAIRPEQAEESAAAAAARYLVCGAVRRSGGRIRVTARLEEVGSGVHLWAERFDRPLDDLFAVQEELADRIAARLAGQLDHEGMRRVRRRPPASLDAYDLCLRGRDLHGRATEADTLSAREMFDRAIALDPGYAPAHAWQALTVQRGFTLWWGEPRGEAALPPALAHAERAMAIEPGSPLCAVALAYIQVLCGRFDEGLEIGRAALLANPSSLEGRFYWSEVLIYAAEDPEQTVREIRAALALDPFHPPAARAQLGRALLVAGRPEEALAELRQCAARVREYAPFYSNLVVAAFETGRMEEARAAVREVRRLRPGWTLRDMAGRWYFRDPAVSERWRVAYRAAGLPE